MSSSVPVGALVGWMLLLTAKHVIADFFLQNTWMAVGKDQRRGWALPLLAHCLVHLAVAMVLILIVAPRFWFVALIDFAIHIAVDRATNGAPARMRFHRYRRDPWRELRTLREVGGNHRGGAKKRFSVMGDQCDRYRCGVHVFPKTARNIVERMAVGPPPRLPDPVGNDVEEFRALSQVGDGEGHCDFHVGTYLSTLNAIARHGHQTRALIGREPMTEQPLAKETVDVLGARMAY